MLRLVFVAVVCCLTLARAVAADDENSSEAKNNVNVNSDDSVPRFYRNVVGPVAVYASSLPYGAYSFTSPIYTSAPITASSHLVPVKEQSVVYQSSNGFLKDSYGNKFVQSPQSMAYKTISPQQFVQIQDLPVHLSRPLVAPPSGYQYKQSTPHFFSSQLRAPSQLASPTPLSFVGYSRPLVYAGDTRSIATPSSLYSNHEKKTPQPTYKQPQQQLSHNGASTSEPSSNQQNSPSFQRFIEQHSSRLKENSNGAISSPSTQHHQQVAQNQQTTVVTGPDGKKIVLTIKTQPSLPLLDLTLLQPLKFDNPVVPQVQHFLPKLSGVTYKALPAVNVNEQKQNQHEFVIQNTKSYDSGIVVGKPKIPSPNIETKNPTYNSDEDHENNVPRKPNKPHRDISENNGPVVSYEINTPNGKETFNEQVVSYNKESNNKPVHYNYDSQRKKKPVHYNNLHSSKKPQAIKNVYYESNSNSNPKNLIYSFPRDVIDQKFKEQSQDQPFNKSEESFDEQANHEGQSIEYEKQKRPAVVKYTRNNNKGNGNRETQHVRPLSESNNSGESSAEFQEEVQTDYDNESQEQPPYVKPNTYNEKPRHSQYNNKHVGQGPVQQYTHQKSPHFQSINDDERYERHYPSKTKQNAPKKQPKRVHHNKEPIVQKHKTHHHEPKQVSHPVEDPVDFNHQPHVYEKFKKIIIQEEAPDEMHSHRELIKEQMIGQEENNEEDFEKSYKNAAYGFPAYDQNPNNDEMVSYDPDSYGVPPTHQQYRTENAPSEEYRDNEDEYPKEMRATYKDARDKVKDDYFSDYSIHRPESMTDYYNDKANYFKTYQNHLKDFSGPKTKTKQNAKYTASPFLNYKQAPDSNPQQYYVRINTAPHSAKHEISRSKISNDNSAFDTMPLHRYRSKTNFVEPQFQYGFEPISIPQLLDSELAAMASNISPESEKNGSRKKIYKENFYIKKTRTSGGDSPS